MVAPFALFEVNALADFIDFNVETFLLPTDAHNVKNTELLKHSKITLQHVSVYIETIFRELQSVLG